MIPIHFENDENAKLLSNGESLTIEAHLDKVYNTKYWTDDASYGLCHRDDITLPELVKLLPQISSYFQKQVEITETCSTLYMNENNKIELSTIPCVTYRIIINNRCVFKKDNIHNGSVLALRDEVVSWIARFIYDYAIFSMILN